ncbi:hypothetical protein [Zhongshania aliphaticivorans]|uniref:hypothetical protein n=1 Tax=Zhongshania aliphaticivorans TaxID=1470434 RepID=UPI0012E6CCFC|nr:hypothetical protein [Zhongshania aliphaticivorans]CAA0117553.1 Uncharacterised protein [Zhongshania aliphaticivorans]
METVLIHGDEWKLEDIQEEISWCREQSWIKQKFTASDAVKQKNHWRKYIPGEVIPKGGEIVPKGHDHEHCQICWWSISESEDPTKNQGYVSGHHWVCTECYGNFIQPK